MPTNKSIPEPNSTPIKGASEKGNVKNTLPPVVTKEKVTSDGRNPNETKTRAESNEDLKQNGAQNPPLRQEPH